MICAEDRVTSTEWSNAVGPTSAGQETWGAQWASNAESHYYHDPFIKQKTTTEPSLSKDKCIPCTVCGRMYSSKRGLSDHMVVKHTGHFKYWCGTCQKGFASRSNYDCHMNKHQGIQYTCQVPGCLKVFSQKKSRKIHQIKEHGMEYL